MSQKIAVVLSGCGYLDGAEIRESVLTMLYLDEYNAAVEIFAPNKMAFHKMDHLVGEEAGEGENILQEAARIARGKIKPLEELNPEHYHGLALPGGFGVAKNLCTFAFKGSQCEVDPQMEKIVQTFYSQKKPIAAVCISPALIARVLGKHGIEVTIGRDQETAAEIEKTGARHVEKDVSEYHLDSKNKIISTPAYMDDSAPLSKIAQGIKGTISELIKLC